MELLTYSELRQNANRSRLSEMMQEDAASEDDGEVPSRPRIVQLRANCERDGAFADRDNRNHCSQSELDASSHVPVAVVS
jgi:hypothetical protein